MMSLDDKAFRYILRYKIDPLFSADDRIEELVHFCDEARIEEVMLFFLAEELSTGHATLEELQPYVQMGKRLKAELGKRCIALSLNPWTTTYPAARGRKLRPGQDFTLIVGENGVASPIAACPLCRNWQRYICETFSYLAQELRPATIWVEDDWRIHNHGAELAWGGCFCNEHLGCFAKIVGRDVTRKELLENVLAPGKPHPWRNIWLDINRKSLLEPAEKLRQAVQKVSADTRLGLMTSNPDMHSIEGRDWSALQRAFGCETASLVRPHMPPYTEEPAIRTPPSMARHTIANLEGPQEIYPELENSPRCGVYSKNGTYSVWECLNAAVYGSAGITINHFDMMGNGISLDRTFGLILAQAKDRLNALKILGIDDRMAEGVKILFSPEVAAHRHSTSTESMHGLGESSTIWSQTLFILGIAHCFSKEIAADGNLYAVNGQTLRAFDDRAIRTLLSGATLLDAMSAEILLERGFGEWIGIQSATWHQQTEIVYSYDSIVEDNPSVFGLVNPRMTAQRCAAQMLDIKVFDGAKIHSSICDPQHNRLFPGAVGTLNKTGGRTFTLAYPFDGGAQFFMGFFNAFRRIMLQRAIFELAPSAPLAVAEDHPLHLYRTPTLQGTLFAAFNVIMDPAKSLVLRVPSGQVDPDKLEVLSDDGQWHLAETKIISDGATDRVILYHEINPLDGMFILHRDK